MLYFEKLNNDCMSEINKFLTQYDQRNLSFVMTIEKLNKIIDILTQQHLNKQLTINNKQ